MTKVVIANEANPTGMRVQSSVALKQRIKSAVRKVTILQAAKSSKWMLVHVINAKCDSRPH